MVSQVKGDFATRNKNVASYFEKVMELFLYFEKFELTQIPRIENIHVDALSKLANSKDSELLKVIPNEHLSRHSISNRDEVMWIEGIPLWMQPLITYLMIKCCRKTKKILTNSGMKLPIMSFRMIYFTKEDSHHLSRDAQERMGLTMC